MPMSVLAVVPSPATFPAPIRAIVATVDASVPEYDGFIGWVLGLMDSLGEVGVGLAVLMETFVPPIPSEAVLPGAGFLAYDGRMNAWLAWLAATLGALVGAWMWYGIGAALGRARTRRFVDRIPLMDGEDFDKAEAFFAKWGGVAVFVGRCVPLVRSFVSIPAGIERMNFGLFTLYTVAGSALWNGIWLGLGFAFGPAIRPVLERWSGVLSTAVVVIMVGVVVWFLAGRLLRARKEPPSL
ncbi:SNARE associated Golgi protein [Jonesia denitrificans DSM 20603]|uniref:SNARE associated Golgi protein n=2 Tax=Jonesia TaxID=43673 RepID=C7QZ56_JONDD|nr:SNARE associated Golgi protein [Jonesia denitrificans DSM 20603]SQH19939.1 SNARE associated Golgi protein [Jonesia denitrificans]